MHIYFDNAPIYNEGHDWVNSLHVQIYSLDAQILQKFSHFGQSETALKQLKLMKGKMIF
jgi:hypothetical protein